MTKHLSTRRSRIAAIVGVSIALTSPLWLQVSPAAASGTGCTSTPQAVGPPAIPGQSATWQTAAYCPRGTGYFYVTATCAINGGGAYWTHGNQRNVAGGLTSNVQCPGGAYPLSWGYSTWG
jgi:hypothetical protein